MTGLTATPMNVRNGTALNFCFRILTKLALSVFAISLLPTELGAKGKIRFSDFQTAIEIGMSRIEGASQGESWEVKTSIDPGTASPESFSIRVSDGMVEVQGSDTTGAMYGLLDVAEQLVMNSGDWSKVEAREGSPRFEFRALKFNLPWDAYRTNEAITLHMDVCKDLEYWEAFLDMMAENRFNVLSLWNLHPFSFMIRPTNFPEACPFSDEELAEWRTLFQGIFRMARERGIDTYIVNWNIFVSEAYQKAHDLPRRGNISVQRGEITQEQMDMAKRYNRECVTQVLNEYPNLTGIGLSLGEAMGGMTAQEREDWMLDSIIRGTQEADRPAKLIHRVPFSAGLSNAGTTSRSTEELTRAALEQIDRVELPIYIEAKFNWSHGHSTPKLIKVHGGKLTDTYWNPLPTSYKMAWMIRNEDFFMLRWGQSDFIRKHIELNGQDFVGGYFTGSETYIPALDYITKSQDKEWTWAFERQWLFYKMWGRLLYDPQTPDTIFANQFKQRYGKQGRKLFDAWQLASKVPLRFASYIDLNNDKSFYSEGFLARDNRDSSQFLDLNLFLKKPVLDPDYISAKSFAEAMLAEDELPEDKITPIELAEMLEEDARTARKLIRGIKAKGREALKQELTDIQAWSLLGEYLADKLRGAIDFAMYRENGDSKNKAAARNHIENGIKHWEDLVELTDPVYRTVPLTHFHYYEDNSFHWKKLLPLVRKDLEIIEGTYIPPNAPHPRFD